MHQGKPQALLQLAHIRSVTLVGQAAAVIFAYWYLQVQLSPWPIFSALALLTLINALTYARLSNRCLNSGWAVTEFELFAHLIADTVIYGFMLYHFGGATNPAVFVLLIPLVISLMALRTSLIWFMSVLVIALYGSLLKYYVPVLTQEHNHHAMSGQHLFNLHVIGMWLNFALTAAVISYFINQMNRSLRKQEALLAERKEANLHQQQILALGTMAAGTAHELGTPLNTMEVLLHDLAIRKDLASDIQEDIELLRTQVNVCSNTLQELAKTVAEEQLNQRLSPVTEFLHEVLEQWQIMRPEVRFTLQEQTNNAPIIPNTTSLRQAILNLLNNAADAEPVDININLSWDSAWINLRIKDQGKGVDMQDYANLGTPFITTKGKGLGIGLFLTSHTLARFGGQVKLYNAEEGGTLTDIQLPCPKTFSEKP